MNTRRSLGEGKNKGKKEEESEVNVKRSRMRIHVALNEPNKMRAYSKRKMTRRVSSNTSPLSETTTV